MNQVVSYEEKMAAKAAQAVANERPPVSTISLQAGQISYAGAPVAGNKLDCIVGASTHANLFYKGKWDADNPTPPVCYAYSVDGKDMVPHPDATEPQHTECASCPHNKWGSGEGKGKACKNKRVLALLPPNGTDKEVAILSVPVTSSKAFSDYVNKVAVLYNLPPSAVLTSISTTPDKKSQFKLTFNVVDKLAPDVGLAVDAVEERLIELIQRSYLREDDEEESPKKRKM